MKDLRRIFHEQGFENVETYIQSGNVVYRGRKAQINNLSESLSCAIYQTHGFKPKVLILDAFFLKNAIKNNPFNSHDEKFLHYGFLASTPQKPDFDLLNKFASNSEDFQLKNNVFYLSAPDGIGRSKLAQRIEKAMTVAVTGRNARTVNKLMSMTGL